MAALPAGTKVLAAEPEFTSLIYPLLAQAGRGVTAADYLDAHYAEVGALMEGRVASVKA